MNYFYGFSCPYATETHLGSGLVFGACSNTRGLQFIIESLASFHTEHLFSVKCIEVIKRKKKRP